MIILREKEFAGLFDAASAGKLISKFGIKSPSMTSKPLDLASGVSKSLGNLNDGGAFQTGKGKEIDGSNSPEIQRYKRWNEKTKQVMGIFDVNKNNSSKPLDFLDEGKGGKTYGNSPEEQTWKRQNDIAKQSVGVFDTNKNNTTSTQQNPTSMFATGKNGRLTNKDKTNAINRIFGNSSQTQSTTPNYQQNTSNFNTADIKMNVNPQPQPKKSYTAPVSSIFNKANQTTTANNEGKEKWEMAKDLGLKPEYSRWDKVKGLGLAALAGMTDRHDYYGMNQLYALGNHMYQNKMSQAYDKYMNHSY